MVYSKKGYVLTCGVQEWANESASSMAFPDHVKFQVPINSVTSVAFLRAALAADLSMTFRLEFERALAAKKT